MRSLFPAVLLLCCLAGTALSDEAGDDTDPSKIVFLSVREEYYNLDDGAWINRIIYRSDKALLKRSRFVAPRGVILRWDFPLATVHAGSETKIGLGDLYFQSLFFPRISKGFNLAAGPAVVFPTATDGLLGSGKWQFAPLVAPIWYFSRGGAFFLLKVQDFISFAGNGSRPDVDYLLTTPALYWRLNTRSWIVLDSEARTDWNSDHTTYKSGFLYGRILSKQFAFWVKPEIPWGSDNPGKWNLKFTVLWVK